MSEEYENIKKFAMSSLGEMPEVIDLLFKQNEPAAMEQFNENQILYLGRKSIPTKVSTLVAMSVALANGPKESVKIHYKLARRFGATNEEIIDAFRVTKMAIMSSTLDSTEVIVNRFDNNLLKERNPEDPTEMLEKVKQQAKEIPDRVIYASKFSVALAKEHLREKGVLLKPLKLENKYVYAIAYAVSVSIHDKDCQNVYINQFLNNGGTLDEIEDLISIVRFISGNRAFVNGLDILREMNK